MSPSEHAEFQIDADGWCAQACRTPTPNFDARPADEAIRLLVIHNISLPPGQFGGSQIADFFCNRLDFDAHPYFDRLRELRVSAHFLIRRDGALIQFVSAAARAWHAGASSFQGQPRCNDFSIGVELEGTDETAFASVQYDTLAALTRAVHARYRILDVAGHEHIAPQRKTDPGPCFDWTRYRQSLAALADLRFPFLPDTE